MNNLRPDDWKEHLNGEDVVILDVRTPKEHEQETIPDSILLNIQERDTFISEIQKFDKNKKYMLYCHAGVRSAFACKLMQQYGFNDVFNLDGGIAEWKQYYETR